MISELVNELVEYGCKKGLVESSDKIFVTNSLLELFQVTDYKVSQNKKEPRSIEVILNDMLEYAFENKIIEDDSITTKDLFDTKIMGLITPRPSEVRKKFLELYKKSPKEATDYYYQLSKATNYIREDRIVKDEKWAVDSEYGKIDITINLSKPEKDPRDIEKAGAVKKSEYPSCLLCKENEGYAGNAAHPARQNHRIIPLSLCGESYYLQYSPYVYYNEHCIVFNDKHTPMVINRGTFGKLLDFIDQFPHYTIGSNADLPIVGGSILSHDHFQGGRYTFAMETAGYDKMFKIDKFPDVQAGILKWPMSVIRLQGENKESIISASDYILNIWRNYKDEEAYIYSETNGIRHNTITPIARKNKNMYEMDLVLRNNITTEKYPLGVFHPHDKLHHIKKENIGLIEVMGLAVLPARLKDEMHEVEQAIIRHNNLLDNKKTASHAKWVEEWIEKYEITEDNIQSIIQKEIGNVFVQVLEDAGVFKRTAQGQKSFQRFIDTL